MEVRSFASVALLAALVGGLLPGCGGDDVDAVPQETPTQTAGTSPSATVPVAASDPKVEALYGEWQTMISVDDPVTLTLRDGAYSIRRGPARGAGRMKATASEAEFSGSDLCDGSGRYKWSIEDGAVTFVLIDKDACSGRSEVLDGKTYRK